HIAMGSVNRGRRTVAGNRGGVRTAQSYQLGVGVREQPALEERIVCQIDSRNHMTGIEQNLFRLGEEVVRIAVQRQLSDALNRHELFGNEFRRVEKIEVKLMFILLLDDL